MREKMKALEAAGKISMDEVVEAAKEALIGLENPGFCLACGERQEGCEPDARKYKCDNCGKREVYGAEEIIVTLC